MNFNERQAVSTLRQVNTSRGGIHQWCFASESRIKNRSGGYLLCSTLASDCEITGDTALQASVQCPRSFENEVLGIHRYSPPSLNQSKNDKRS